MREIDIMKISLLFIALFLSGFMVTAQDIKWDDRLEMGVEDSVEFYLVDDVESDVSGNIFITDRAANKIYKFNDGNRLLDQTGRSGRGPAEFRGGPSTMAVSGDSLIVFDQSDAHIAHLYESNTLEYRTTMDLRYVRSAAMNSEGKVFMSYHDYVEDRFLHSYDLDKEIQQSYLLENMHEYTRLNVIEIYVSSIDGHMILVFPFLNRVEVLDKDGSLVRRISLPDLPGQAEVEQMENADHMISRFQGRKAEVVERGSYLPQYKIFKGSAVHPGGYIFLQKGVNRSAENKTVTVVDLQGEQQFTFELPSEETLMHADARNHFYTKSSDEKVYKYRLFDSLFQD